MQIFLILGGFSWAKKNFSTFNTAKDLVPTPNASSLQPSAVGVNPGSASVHENDSSSQPKTQAPIAPPSASLSGISGPQDGKIISPQINAEIIALKAKNQQLEAVYLFRGFSMLMSRK